MALPAEPVLAASMWTNEAHDDYDDDDDTDATVQLVRQKLPTDVHAIDAALDGGFEHGAVHCIIPDTDQDPGALIRALLVSHLRSSPLAVASLIESTSSFDVRQLYKALEAEQAGGGGDEGQSALQMLERLKMMKVFDHVGLAEAMSEIQEELERDAVVEVAAMEAAKVVPKSTIQDSEDEDEDEDEMLELPDPSEVEKQQRPKGPASREKQSPNRLLIVDNIAHFFSPLIKNNYAGGQASLAHFMRVLGHATRAHEVCTVLVSNTSNKPASEGETLSLFGSCTVQPALTVGFGSLVDVLIYLHSVPAMKATEADKQSKTRAMMSVFEVVQDRRGSCFGRFGPFIRDPEGRVRDV